MTFVAALALGLLIGAVLGALGGGGAILTVPILVYILGETAHEATTSSLVIVGITSFAGAFGHARAHHVRWGTALSFGVTGIAAAFAGTALNRHIDQRVVLIGFAAVMIAAATGMLIKARKKLVQPDQPRTSSSPGPTLLEPGPMPAPGATALAELTRSKTSAPPINRARVLKVIGAGLVVGFMTGLFGVGGGFIIVPALTLVLGMEMPSAAGTSLLIIALNSGTSLLARAGSAHFDWAVIIPFTTAAVAGTAAGQRTADRLSVATLNRAFAVLLILVALYVAGHNLLTLARL